MVLKGGKHSMYEIEHDAAYYEWYPLVDAFSDMCDSQGEYVNHIAVEKANHVHSRVKFCGLQSSMEDLLEIVAIQYDHLVGQFGEVILKQYARYREQMLCLSQPMTRSKEKQVCGSMWKTIQKLRASLYASMGKEITKDTPVLLACSGGVDSIALLHLLYVEGFHEVAVFTMDHGLREEAREEVELVTWYARQMGLAVYAVKEEVDALANDQGVSFETMGRTLRYGHMRRICQEDGYDYIVTAHHKNDQAETILAHLLRGAGVEGLQGMVPLTEEIWRPCLDVSKDMLQDYANWLGCFYGEDRTNQDVTYERNWIRHALIPLGEERNPQFVDTICQMSRLMVQDAKYFTEQVDRAWQDCRVAVRDSSILYCLQKQRLKTLPDAILSRLWRRLLAPYVRPSQLHQETIRTLMQLSRSGAGKKFLFSQVQVITSYDTITVVLCSNIETKNT